MTLDVRVCWTLAMTVRSILIIVVSVLLVQVLYHRLPPRLRRRMDSPWAEPNVSLGRDAPALVLLILVGLGAAVLARACPLPGL